MKKIIFQLLFLSIAVCTVNAQDDDFYGLGTKDEKASKKELRQKKLENWSFGGHFWLSFGTNSALVEVAPVAMYKLTPRLLIGPGLTYNYYKWKEFNKTYETSVFGARGIATFTVLSDLDQKININVGNIILHGEYEWLNRGVHYMNGDFERVWYDNLLVGGGIYQPFGNRGGLSFMILYEVIQHKYTLYNNPIIRMGFYF